MNGFFHFPVVFKGLHKVLKYCQLAIAAPAMCQIGDTQTSCGCLKRPKSNVSKLFYGHYSVPTKSRIPVGTMMYYAYHKSVYEWWSAPESFDFLYKQRWLPQPGPVTINTALSIEASSHKRIKERLKYLEALQGPRESSKYDVQLEQMVSSLALLCETEEANILK